MQKYHSKESSDNLNTKKNDEDMLPKMMTVRQIAELEILSEYTIRRLLKEGKFHAVYSGKKALINVDSVRDYLNGIDKAG